MSGPVRGWCPGALRPMMSGDGLVVRLRPRLGRIGGAQAAGLADLARRHGSGVIELTRRANLQIRGVSEAAHPALLDGLAALGPLDPDPEAEARRNILVAPFDADSPRIAGALEAALPRLPPLPAKFGFAVDAGPAPLFGSAPADIRIERGARGLLLRADGAATGRAVGETEAIAAALDLARWFAARRGAHHRMAPLLREVPLPDRFAGTAPRPAGPRPAPGLRPEGALAGLPFGQMEAGTLAALAAAPGLRLTPWRLILVEGADRMPPGLVSDPADPLLAVDACPGAPFCAQASVETRPLARRLAHRLPGLHVSGCAKGCARSTAAPVTLVGRGGRFDLVKHGRAGDTPTRSGLSPEDLEDDLDGLTA